MSDNNRVISERSQLSHVQRNMLKTWRLTCLFYCIVSIVGLFAVIQAVNSAKTVVDLRPEGSNYKISLNEGLQSASKLLHATVY